MGLVIGLFSNLSSILAGVVQEQGKFTLRKSSKFISHFEIGKTSRNSNGVCKCAWAISINSFSDLIEFPETVTTESIHFLSIFFSVSNFLQIDFCYGTDARPMVYKHRTFKKYLFSKYQLFSNRFLRWYCSWHDADARPMIYKTENERGKRQESKGGAELFCQLL